MKDKYYNIAVNLTDEDLHELQQGKEFNWNWNTEEDENVIIKIKLFNGDDEDDDCIGDIDDCELCNGDDEYE